LSALHTKTTDKMNNFRFQKITVVSVFILLVNIINCGYSASVPNKDDLFTVNITMNNFQTTRVYIYKKKIIFLNVNFYFVFLLGR